jgi:hypothetical protein
LKNKKKGLNFVVYLGSHGDQNLSNCDIILPLDLFLETECIFVNLEGYAQVSNMVLKSPADSRDLYSILNAFSLYFLLLNKAKIYGFLNDSLNNTLGFISKTISISERLKQTLPI